MTTKQLLNGLLLALAELRKAELLVKLVCQVVHIGRDRFRFIVASHKGITLLPATHSGLGNTDRIYAFGSEYCPRIQSVIADLFGLTTP